MPKEKELAGQQEPSVEAPPMGANVEETWEQQQQRRLREDFIKRNTEAIEARSGILRENGLPDDTQAINLEEAAKRCCS